jgi:hypothetical protein
MSDITLAAGVFGGVKATGLTRWLKGKSGFEPRTALKFALYLQALTNEVKPNSERDRKLAAAYKNFAETGSHRIWGDTPQSALSAAYDWLLYGPGKNPPPGASTGRHEALKWPNAAAILGADLKVAGGLKMGQLIDALDELDPDQLHEIAGAALDRLTEMAQVVEGAIEVVEVEPPCDPDNPLLLLLRGPLQLTTPPTADDIERVAKAARIETGRMQALLCGWDLPTEGEADQLHAAAGPALVPRLIHKYFEIRALSADVKLPAVGDV